MHFQIQVPVKLYVKDYYENSYGSPVFASKDNIVGIITEPFLQKTPSKPEFSDHASPLLITLSWAGMYRGFKDVRVHNYVSPHNSKLLGKALEKIFWNIFYAFMNANVYSPNEVKITHMIEKFMNINDIDPMNGSLEMFTKAYYRYTKKSFAHLSNKYKAS